MYHMYDAYINMLFEGCVVTSTTKHPEPPGACGNRGSEAQVPVPTSGRRTVIAESAEFLGES